MAASHTDWFVQDRFGMFIHWGLYAIPARGEWVRNKEEISVEAYQPYFDEFNPTRYDPKKWARIAVDAGMKYVVLTTKHHDGFCLFDSKLTDYKSTNTPAQRDLVAEYVEAMREAGLKVGFYYSLLDWHHPHYPVDGRHPMRNNEAMKSEQRDTGKYVDYLHGQVRELLSNYGEIDVLWFDFSYDNMSGQTWRAKELVEMVRKLQPGIIMNNRLFSGHAAAAAEGSGMQYGDLETPEQIIPSAGVTDKAGNPKVWEACITLNNNWGYARDDHNYKSPAQVVRMLVECVSKGGNLLLNVGPDAKGEIPAESVAILERVGQWMRINGQSIYGAGRAAELVKPDWGRYTRAGDHLFAHLMDRPVGPVAIDGLPGKLKKARVLADGSEVKTSRPWNAAPDQANDFLTLRDARLPDELDTVVELFVR